MVMGDLDGGQIQGVGVARGLLACLLGCRTQLTVGHGVDAGGLVDKDGALTIDPVDAPAHEDGFFAHCG